MPRRHHALDAASVAAQLGVDPAVGLTDEEAAHRLAKDGPNLLPVVRGQGIGHMLRDQFGNVVVALLVAAGLLSYLTGERPQAMAIGVVLIANAAIGLATEWQSERALDALRHMLRMTATVRRRGRTLQLDASDLVAGDVVLLSAGDRIPADLRIVEAAGLTTQEAQLTGESRATVKAAHPVDDDTILAERSSILFLGTTVAAGRATAIVVATGAETELGKIGGLIAQIENEPTKLQQRLNQLGRRVVYGVLVIGVVVTIAGRLRGEPLVRMIEVGLSLAVAAVPESLPAVTTFILAFGVLRMAQRKAIVRHLSAVETLGNTTVICSDKTGTLTTGEMTAVEVRLNDGRSVDPRQATTPPFIEIALIAALCNDATVQHGDPTEVALARAAQRLGIDVADVRRKFPRISEEPFDATTRRMITVHREFAAMKGALSAVLPFCNPSLDEEAWFGTMDREMAGRGLRVLAFAIRRDSAASYRFAGLIGITDPPRSGVAAALARAKEAGIRIVMLTGDQLDTARSIARELHIGDRVRHGRDIQDVRSDELASIVEQTDAFARVSPEHKYNIVEALQRRGEIVAVTGDGVNDAPALKKADVGVAMGARGTEMAKETADIVLADDNFATIVSAVESGRAIYDNIIKFVQMMFSHNLNEVITIFAAIVFAWPLPLLPLQILWLNVATDVLPAFALALDPPAPELMRRPPRSPSEPLFSRALIAVIGWQALMLGVVSLSIYDWALSRYGAGEHAHTVAVLTLIAVEIAQTFNCRSQTRSAFDGLFRNRHIWFAAATVIALQAAIFVSPASMRILGLVRPSAADFVALAIALIVPVAVVEAWKVHARHRDARHRLECAPSWPNRYDPA